MNTTMTAVRRHDHPPEQLDVQRPLRRVGLFDRLALRLGLALLVWARRPRRVQAERHISPAEVADLRAARYSSQHLLTLIR